MSQDARFKWDICVTPSKAQGTLQERGGEHVQVGGRGREQQYGMLFWVGHGSRTWELTEAVDGLHMTGPVGTL